MTTVTKVMHVRDHEILALILIASFYQSANMPSPSCMPEAVHKDEQGAPRLVGKCGVTELQMMGSGEGGGVGEG